jgi:hypothetical protein
MYHAHLLSHARVSLPRARAPSSARTMRLPTQATLLTRAPRVTGSGPGTQIRTAPMQHWGGYNRLAVTLGRLVNAGPARTMPVIYLLRHRPGPRRPRHRPGAEGGRQAAARPGESAPQSTGYFSMRPNRPYATGRRSGPRSQARIQELVVPGWATGPEWGVAWPGRKKWCRSCGQHRPWPGSSAVRRGRELRPIAQGRGYGILGGYVGAEEDGHGCGDRGHEIDGAEDQPVPVAHALGAAGGDGQD